MRLSEKLEAADASEQRELLLAVFDQVMPGTRTTSCYVKLSKFIAMLDCGAYESAALTLLPDGWQVDSLSKWDAAPESADNPSQARSQVCLLETSIQRMRCGMIWGHSSNGDRRVEAVSSTPALALCAAICRAKGI